MSSSRELRVTIAGVTTAIVSREPDLALGVGGPFASFIDPDATPQIRLDAVWGVAGEPAANRLFDSGGVWRLFADRDAFDFRLHSPNFGGQPYKTATVRRDFTSGVIHLRRECFDPSRPIYPLEYPLDELLITNWLSLGRGVEVHACAVVDVTGDGYLFAGHSGAGKTTIARQWCDERGIAVLSDDRVVLRRAGREILMHGTPWHGDEPLAARRHAPLRRAFILRHAASRNQLRAITGGDAVAALFARSFPPPFSAPALDFTLSFLADVVQSVPVFDLGFVPDGRIRDFVRAAV